MTTSLARGTSCHKVERTCRVSYRNRLRTGMMDLTLTQVPLCQPLRRLSHGTLCIEVVKQRRGCLLLHQHRHRSTDLIRQHRYRNRCCTPWGGDPTRRPSLARCTPRSRGRRPPWSPCELPSHFGELADAALSSPTSRPDRPNSCPTSRSPVREAGPLRPLGPARRPCAGRCTYRDCLHGQRRQAHPQRGHRSVNERSTRRAP
jgi:hypothetical protein